MGWSGGTEVARRMIKVIKDNVEEPEVKTEIYSELIDALQDCDWDTLEEAMRIDPIFDAVLLKLNPDMEVDDEDDEDDDDEDEDEDDEDAVGNPDDPPADD